MIHRFICFVICYFFGTFLFAQSDTTITLRAITGLQYDLPRFAVKPNQTITILLKNDDDMAHNLVIVKPNTRLDVVAAALKLESKGPAFNYVPASPNVLVFSKILIPNETETLTFKAPAKEGAYPYVCTYPGHGYVMYGAMYVTTKPLPPLAKDANVPPSRQAEEAAHAHQHEAPSPHPFAREYPLLYRTFMPDCGPAAIAVALSPTHSYCFDAGKCYLRYAWTGGFIDNTDHWKGNGNALAKIEGQVYFQDQAEFPIRIGAAEKLPKVRFKGYSLTKRLPTFKYTLDDIEVSETVQSLPQDGGLTRTFVFAKPLRELIYFMVQDERVLVTVWPAKTKTKTKFQIPKGTQKVVVTTKKK